MHLTPTMLEAAYEYLKTTPPFRRWKLPSADHVEFRVTRDQNVLGYYQPHDKDGRHIVGISAAKIDRTETLMETMAHEMVHLRQHLTRSASNGGHNVEFQRIGAQVCKQHGFNPKFF